METNINRFGSWALVNKGGQFWAMGHWGEDFSGVDINTNEMTNLEV